MVDENEAPAIDVQEDSYDGPISINWDAIANLPLSFVNVVGVQYHHDQQTFYLALGAVPLPLGGITQEMLDNGVSVRPVAHVVMPPTVMQLLLAQMQEANKIFAGLVEESQEGTAS